ncbi:uncharacterized protein LOC143259058 isoform X2 [Megalopta genalis]|uniref:uncharacterized protein LOC143259058 isoform X2 n=1 Tax=Megalopta genalis TaxID=115081 RepID=UPI003FD64FC6
MKFVLIPFFLAANVTVNNPAKWQHGLVSHFHANMTSTKVDLGKVDLTLADVICRQRSIYELICSIDKILVKTWYGLVTEIVDVEPEFLIQFSVRGIESFRFQQPIGHKRLNRVRSIFQQLSVGADLLRHADELSTFVAPENHVLGNCSSLFTVLQYGNDDGCFANNCDKKRNYELNVLSLPERRPGATVVIEKWTNRNKCENYRVDDTIVTEKTRTKMHIGLSTFTSQTEIDLKINNRAQMTMISPGIRVELTGIEPAKEKLPNLSFEHSATLAYRDRPEYNFL